VVEEPGLLERLGLLVEVAAAYRAEAEGEMVGDSLA
jgi:hypothetical protein